MFCTWSYLAILDSIIRSLQIPILPSSLSFWKIQQYYIPEHSRPKLENIVQLAHICISNYILLGTYLLHSSKVKIRIIWNFFIVPQVAPLKPEKSKVNTKLHFFLILLHSADSKKEEKKKNPSNQHWLTEHHYYYHHRALSPL